jgi:hypothetical protein
MRTNRLGLAALGRRSLLPSLALAAACLGTSAMAGDVEDGHGLFHRRKAGTTAAVHHAPGAGTLGYGPPGVHPGFQGFGLGYHLGYGYGGQALGPGAFGGYPFYGGPGYPHPWPRLRRIGGINPFPHYGGPGFPTPAHPNYYGGVGAPLAVDAPVVTILPEPGEADYASGFGTFTGAVPYPESYFAPFTTAAAASGTSGAPSMPAPADSGPSPASDR